MATWEKLTKITDINTKEIHVKTVVNRYGVAIPYLVIKPQIGLLIDTMYKIDDISRISLLAEIWRSRRTECTEPWHKMGEVAYIAFFV